MNELYVANLPADISIEHLRELFSVYGDVLEIKLHSEKYQQENKAQQEFFAAYISMPTEKSATKAMNALNGQLLDGHRLAVSPVSLEFRPFLPKQRQAFEDFAKTLNETDKKPLRILKSIVILCGVAFTRAIVEEAVQLQNQGGLLRNAEDDHRTLGGIFFYLARFRMSKPIRKIVYTRKGKFPQQEQTLLAEQNSDTATV